MQRYFIDVYNGEVLAVDEDGQDFPDVETARDFALIGLRDIVWRSGFGDGMRLFTVTIKDRHGTRLYKASMRFESDWTARPDNEPRRSSLASR